jgi:hypothetical protein
VVRLDPLTLMYTKKDAKDRWLDIPMINDKEGYLYVRRTAEKERWLDPTY